MEKRVFLREATGLTKELSFFDALSVSLSYTCPGFGILLYTFYGPSTFPGVNLLVALALMGAFLLIYAVSAGQMMAVMPRSGFDYVFVSRVTRPVIGFSSSFLFFAFLSILTGGFYTFISSALSNYFTSLGLVTGNNGLSAVGSTLLQPVSIIIIGTLLNALIVGITLGGLKVGKMAIIIMELIGWASLVVALAIIASNSQQAFSSAWNNYVGGQLTYSSAAATAQNAGLTYMSGGGALLAATFWTFFSIFGFQGVGYMGGEIKRAQTTIIKAMVTALLVTVFVTAIAVVIIQNTMGYDFLASASYLNVIGSVAVSPYYLLAASLLFPNTAIVSLMYIGLFLWVLVTIYGNFLAMTRTLFAWSFDRVVPTFFANVSEKYHSPTWSIVTIGLLLEVGVFISQYTLFGTFANLGLMFIIISGISSLATALLPWLRPELFKSAPKFVSYKIGGAIPVVTLTGGAASAFFWILVYEAFVNPALTGSVTWLTVVTLVSAAALGGIIYTVSKVRLRSQGIDLGLVFKEIPPD